MGRSWRRPTTWFTALLAGSSLLGSSLLATAPTAAAGVHLTVWSNLTPPEINVIKYEALQWAKRTGNSVTVIPNPSNGFQGFATAATTGKGPDIVFGLPHDNLGTFWKAGLLAPVPKGLIDTKAYIPSSLDAVSFGGKLYAVPVLVETYALVYNKKLISKPPTTWSQLIAEAKKLTIPSKKQYGFLMDINNFYYDYAFISGYGGYVFKQTRHGLDPNNIGLDTPGAIRGLTLIADLVRKYKLVPQDTTTPIMESEFSQGKAAMIIDGPWSISGFLSSHIDVGVAPLPQVAPGKPMHPFSGVQAAFVSAMSKNQAVAWQLMRYLIQYSSVPLFKAGNRIPAVEAYANSPLVKQNPIASAFAAEARLATPMPNIPQMQAVWGPAGQAVTLITSGKLSPAAGARIMVQNIRKSEAQLGQ